MCKEKPFPSHLLYKWLKVQNHPALPEEVVGKPDIVITNEEMHLHPTVGQLGYLSEDARKPFGYNIPVLIPVVEDIAQEIDRFSFLLHTVQPAAHLPFRLHGVGV